MHAIAGAFDDVADLVSDHIDTLVPPGGEPAVNDVAMVVGPVEVGRGMTPAVLALMEDRVEVSVRPELSVRLLRITPHPGHERQEPFHPLPRHVLVEVDRDLSVGFHEPDDLVVLEPVLSPRLRRVG